MEVPGIEPATSWSVVRYSRSMKALIEKKIETEYKINPNVEVIDNCQKYEENSVLRKYLS